MSRNLLITSKVCVSTFYGGHESGPMLQLEVLEVDDLVRLNRAEVSVLTKVLNKWLAQQRKADRFAGGEPIEP